MQQARIRQARKEAAIRAGRWGEGRKREKRETVNLREKPHLQEAGRKTTEDNQPGEQNKYTNLSFHSSSKFLKLLPLAEPNPQLDRNVGPPMQIQPANEQVRWRG
jgi:hypothetical protein